MDGGYGSNWRMRASPVTRWSVAARAVTPTATRWIAPAPRRASLPARESSAGAEMAVAGSAVTLVAAGAAETVAAEGNASPTVTGWNVAAGTAARASAGTP